MDKKTICRVAGGVLVFLVGVAVGLAAAQLWSGTPSSWPGLMASASTMQRTAISMLVLAVFLVVAGSAAIVNLRWGKFAATTGVLLFVAGGFWANYTLFGEVRPLHTGANIVVGGVILLLLWNGSRREQ